MYYSLLLQQNKLAFTEDFGICIHGSKAPENNTKSFKTYSITFMNLETKDIKHGRQNINFKKTCNFTSIINYFG